MFKKAAAFDGPLLTYTLITGCRPLSLAGPVPGRAPPDGSRTELLRPPSDDVAHRAVPRAPFPRATTALPGPAGAVVLVRGAGAAVRVAHGAGAASPAPL